MTTTISRPVLGSEPEPQHDRIPDNPPALPPLPQREPGRSLQHRADDRADALNELLARLVAEGDRRAAAAGRCAPRTVAQMRARLAAPATAGGAR
ncbi:hypothetical protein JJV70_15940 [Streptomyces sp. JJ66]|uniref:hypothetical protein n=1 Tax=Streptomyces sp. JJ66 TaxID=2803843 RepID=UPI001C57ECFA|nr:hypothetical protein [Streptomyces sp. JJ66]MBW1603567.1 hypothetical protein [Streptomyces sp. JJ66]